MTQEPVTNDETATNTEPVDNATENLTSNATVHKTVPLQVVKVYEQFTDEYESMLQGEQYTYTKQPTIMGQYNGTEFTVENADLLPTVLADAINEATISSRLPSVLPNLIKSVQLAEKMNLELTDMRVTLFGNIRVQVSGDFGTALKFDSMLRRKEFDLPEKSE